MLWAKCVYFSLGRVLGRARVLSRPMQRESTSRERPCSRTARSLIDPPCCSPANPSCGKQVDSLSLSLMPPDIIAGEKLAPRQISSTRLISLCRRDWNVSAGCTHSGTVRARLLSHQNAGPLLDRPTSGWARPATPHFRPQLQHPAGDQETCPEREFFAPTAPAAGNARLSLISIHPLVAHSAESR